MSDPEPIIILTCNRCSHQWARRRGRDDPKHCPKCKSPYWNKPRVKGVQKEQTP